MINDPIVLVGNAADGTLTTLRLENEKLTPLSTTTVGEGCSTFAIDTTRRYLYVATKDPKPAIVTLGLDQDTGIHPELSRLVVDDPLAYLAVTPRGHMLLAASYHGGWGATYRIVDGVLVEESSRLEHRNLHAAVVDPQGHNAYFVSLGDDLITQHAITVDGGLVDLSEPVVKVTPGSGPRHLVISEDGRHAYLITEFTGEAVRFDRTDSGRLTWGESVPGHDVSRELRKSSYGLDPMEGHLIWGADIDLAGGGRWLLCSERTESTITTIEIDEKGHLVGQAAVTDTETQPRGLTVSPDGQYVVVVGERSNHASLYRIYDDGALVLLDRVETGKGPNWVRFA